MQRFRSQLTDQLDALHKTVSSSVMQQEGHLKEMESDMQSFVSSKDEAIQSLVMYNLAPNVCSMNLYVLICMNYPFSGCTRAKGKCTKTRSPAWFRYHCFG